jgi:hypothetical protein
MMNARTVDLAAAYRWEKLRAIGQEVSMVTVTAARKVGHYSPMIFTRARFRLRPSNTP